MSEVKKIGPVKFVRMLKRRFDSCKDCRYAFFIGAGCSISSGIPGARDLVWDWLPQLQHMEGGEGPDPHEWAKKNLDSKYTKETAAKYYSQVIQALFPNVAERQTEIERIVSGKDHGFGYSVLAQLMSYDKYSRHCNAIITVNFDDLVSDALYLYTKKKPLIISHEYLIEFVKMTSVRPIVIKAHGDALLSPKNTSKEIEALSANVQETLRNFLSERGLIFMGYGANDESIAKLLQSVPKKGLDWDIYWVGNAIPQTPIGGWLRERGAYHVTHQDFDELMLLFRNEFDLPHPDGKRFSQLTDNYRKKFEELGSKIAASTDSETKVALSEAMDRAIKDAKDWWSVELLARKEADPERKIRIYEEGLKRFPRSYELMTNYGNFLKITRKDYDKAEEYYQKAVATDPTNSLCLGNYAFFLHKVRNDYIKADEYYKKAEDANPDYANNLGNYANFLYVVRKDYNKSEYYYKKAVVSDPNNATNLGNYGNFLYTIRKDYGKSEEYYQKALACDPNNANNLGNYAGFLLACGNVVGFQYLEKAIALSKGQHDRPLHLECHFYRYAHATESAQRLDALREIKGLLTDGVSSPGWDLSRNVERAKVDEHPEPVFLEALAKVVAGEADIASLDAFPVWQSTQAAEKAD